MGIMAYSLLMGNAEFISGTVPRGSYPTPFLGYLVLWLGSVILKSRSPKKGVGYEPLGVVALLMPGRPPGHRPAGGC